MRKGFKLLFISIFCILFIGLGLYFLILRYGYRDFGEMKGWKQLASYEFYRNKFAVDSALHKVVDSSSSLKFAKNPNTLSNEGWVTVHMITPEDSTEFIFRFKGDSTFWDTENGSEILLFSVADKQVYLSPTTIKELNKKVVKEKIALFETLIIQPMKKHFGAHNMRLGESLQRVGLADK